MQKLGSPHAGAWAQLPSEPAIRKRRLLSNKAIFSIFGAVCVLCALRYVLDVKISVKWRHNNMLQQHDGTRHCSNSCFKARDGVCDEGRPPRSPSHWEQQAAAQKQAGLPKGVSAVLCDLGTDCSDCGPWWGLQADEGWAEALLPIAFLRRANVSVRVRPTSHAVAPANFSFAYTDPALDVDVSKNYEEEGVVEVGISQIFYKLLSKRCGSGQRSGLVLDVGSNFGWFSLLSAWLGCSVIAWEPVPQFAALLSFNLALNRLGSRVEVRRAAVADPPGSKQLVVVPNRGIWGTAGILGANLDAGVRNEGSYQQVEVVAESVDEVLAGRQAALLKVDVEGYEASVLATANKSLAAGLIDNIVLEYSPGILERAARWSEMAGPPQMLLDLTTAGFKLGHLSDEFVRVWAPGRSITAKLPSLRHITPHNLAYDIWDAHAFPTGWLDVETAGPFCQEMIELHLDNSGVPERLHPKSYHSMFGHNTNVWASRQREEIEPFLGKPVGIFPLHVPMTDSWFPPEGSDEGLGGTTCKDLTADLVEWLSSAEGKNSTSEVAVRMGVLIGRRCRCTHQLPCERHAAAAERCAREGRTPYID